MKKYYEVRIRNTKSVLISIKIDASINLGTKKMTRIILNCPVKKLCNINFNIDSFFERTNDRPGQPEEPGINLKTALFPKTVYKVRVKLT